MSNNKRPFPNKDIFEVVDTEEKAYWLGFLYADGSVGSAEHKIELGLKIEDIGHVQKFKDFVELSNKISIREKTKSCRFSFRSLDFKNNLIKQGCFPNKSLILKFPTYEQVPKHLMKHFMRGYFDGDGWICHTDKTECIGFIGTYDFVDGVIKEFNLKQNKIANVHHENGAKRYQLYQKDEFIKFLDLLYQDATIYLDRKYEKYLSYKK